MKEIGSEFWKATARGDIRYLLSGRTALELIVRDIVAEYEIHTVYMPSYCCHTMIMPFLLHGFDIHFYDVFCDNGMTVEIPEPIGEAAFFLIRYFGYEQLRGLDLESIRSDFKIIIEDRTHSWLSAFSEDADYAFASFKKWTAISGIAKAEKRRGRFLPIVPKSFTVFEEMREQAFDLKRRYLEMNDGDKNKFLSLFSEAEELLENDYVDYVPSAESYECLMNLDTEGMCLARRRNAAHLLEGLKSIPEIKLVNNELGSNDVPLCVPVLVPNGRNELRRYLIDNAIYLPIHWPISEYHRGISEMAKHLYDEELSVVCDQRYNEDDMERIINTMREFYLT